MSQENTSTTTSKDAGKKITAFSLAFIVLAASLVGVVALYFINDNALQTQITEKNNTINSMNSTIRQLQGQLVITSDKSAYINQIANLQSQIETLNESISEYVQILNLALVESDFQNFTQDANSSTLLWEDIHCDYGGFITLEVQATANSTYVNMAYLFANHYLFNQTITVGKSGTVSFPVVTATYVSISVGNVNETSSNLGNVTLTYRY